MAPKRFTKTKQAFGNKVTIREAVRQANRAQTRSQSQSSLGESEPDSPISGPPLAPIGSGRRFSSRADNDISPTRRSGGRPAAQAGPSTRTTPSQPAAPRQTPVALPLTVPSTRNGVTKTPSPISRRAKTPSPKGTPSKPKFSPSEGTFGRTRSGRAYAAPSRPTTVLWIFEELNYAPNTSLPALVNTFPLLEEVPVVAEGVFDTSEELGLLQGHARFLRMLISVAVALEAGGCVDSIRVVTARVPDAWQVEWNAVRLAYAEFWRDLAYRDDIDELLRVIGEEGLGRLPRPQTADGEELSDEEIRNVGKGIEGERRGRVKRSLMDAKFGSKRRSSSLSRD